MATPKCDGCGACQNEGKMDSINCRLCGGATYCNEQCASEAWSAHASECNLHTVPTVNTLVAMPYGFQDVLDATFESENHLTQHVNQTGLISSRVLAFSTPHLVAAQEAPAKWAITVNGVEATAIASGKNDCITAKAPGRAGKLASQRSPSAGTTLWTPLAAPIAVSPQEKMVVAVVDKTTGKAVTSIEFQLPPALDADVFADMSRKERGLIQSQLAEKKTSLAAVTPYVVQDERSTVRLLIDKNDNLVDIEYQLCGATLPEWSTQRFQCDSRDIDHVSGLLMAVSDRIEGLQLAGQEVSALKNDYNTIYGHYTALHDNLEAEPSASVNAAIHRCTQAQFAEISRPSFREGLSRVFSGFKRSTKAVQTAKSADKGVEQLVQSVTDEENAYQTALKSAQGGAAKQAVIQKYDAELASLSASVMKSLQSRLESSVMSIAAQSEAGSATNNLVERALTVFKGMENVASYGHVQIPSSFAQTGRLLEQYASQKNSNQAGDILRRIKEAYAQSKSRAQTKSVPPAVPARDDPVVTNMAQAAARVK